MYSVSDSTKMSVWDDTSKRYKNGTRKMNRPTAANSMRRATLTGSTAILMWSTLALLTEWSGSVPPFQLTALSFTIAFGVGFAYWRRQRVSMWKRLTMPLHIWALGVLGLFGYHFFYFMALRHAPAVEASLIAYLWPLLIVLFSALLPGERLAWFHVAGRCWALRARACS